jgi:Replicative DNA helicase
MVSLQIINKILSTKSMDILTNNNLDVQHFSGYADEYSFIKNHYDTYGMIPDIPTFISVFQEFQLLEVAENDEYLVQIIREELLYSEMAILLNDVADKLKTNSFDALDHVQLMVNELKTHVFSAGVDIIQDKSRLDTYNAKKENPQQFFLSTGFPELDNLMGGLSRGEELAIVFARTGKFKTWVVTKMLTHNWQEGLNVGMISPEMSPDKMGYRFDTLNEHISNKSLLRGVDIENFSYDEYIHNLSEKKNVFIIAQKKHFMNKQITVTRIKNFCLIHKLDMLVIDGLAYLTDERQKQKDNKTTTLTNISEDLMQLSIDLKIPIILVMQSNRTGVRKEDEKDQTPDIDNIRDSDGPSHNATKIIAVGKSNAGCHISVKKNRDYIGNANLLYAYDVDRGIFTFTPSQQDKDVEHAVKTSTEQTADKPIDSIF